MHVELSETIVYNSFQANNIHMIVIQQNWPCEFCNIVFWFIIIFISHRI